MAQFTYQTKFPYSKQKLYNWHTRKGALQRLLPPWEKTTVISQKGGIAPGGEVYLRMHFGPIPFKFVAHHVHEQKGQKFRDIQHRGPFSNWSHTHIFSDTENNGSILTDNVEYTLPCHQLLPSPIKKFVGRELQRSFQHRENILQNDLKRHQTYSQRPLRILISGASGVIGKHLLPFLTTGGHQVWTLVRRKPREGANEIYWNPAKNEIDTQAIPELDAVIHLAGEYIGLGRWSDKKKKRVIESRTKGTDLLARTLLKLPTKPKVFLSSSAIGYYGNRRQENISETTSSGPDFLSHICKVWEEAAKPATDGGIRTVLMRMGIGLSCQGGALQKLISAPIGYVRRFGDGQQNFSWISMDDLIAAILHCIHTTVLEGPVNIVSPNPVTNEELIASMAELTKRPFLPGAPATLLKLLYGEMAKEILLSSCHASADKLLNSGFVFHHPTLNEALRSQLGIYDQN